MFQKSSGCKIADFFRFALVTIAISVALTFIDLPLVARRDVAQEEMAQTRVVGRNVPVGFAVVVVSRPEGKKPQAALVDYHDLAGYFKKHPNCTFTVELSKVDEYNRQINQQTQNANGIPDDGTFEVAPGPHGSQKFFVEGITVDEDGWVFRSWYTATDHAVRPTNYMSPYRGVGAQCFTMLDDLPTVGALNLVAGAIICLFINVASARKSGCGSEIDSCGR